MIFCPSFIGITQTLPMTAYIKMIEIWMIFAMVYPLCVVTLYSVLQYVKAHEQDIPIPLEIKKVGWRNTSAKSATRIVNLLLDFGLPLIFLLLIIMFFILGNINTTSTVFNNSC